MHDRLHVGFGYKRPDLLLKIGGAVLETDQHDVPAVVYLSLAELWMIREVTKSSVVVGSERVGNLCKARSVCTSSPHIAGKREG